MKTFLFDLDDTILDINWPVFEQKYYAGLAKAFLHILPESDVIKCIYKSYIYMVEVIDQRTNKEKFYDKMEDLCGVAKDILIAQEPLYYQTQYDSLKSITAPMPNMVAAVRRLKEKGYPMLIASQPVFPAIATLKRLSWTGFEAEDFLKVTSFETEYACKPHSEYFENLIKEFELDPEDCVMVGNDRHEDMVAALLGIESILITDRMIDSDDNYLCREMTAAEFQKYVEEI